jgi:hypothetical protein
MQFSLRTIFIIFTTVAVYTAVEVALYRSAPDIGSSRSLYTVALLPLFVLWVVAACWVFEHRRTLEAYRLVLLAILLNIGSRLFGEVITTLGYHFVTTSRNGLGAAVFALSSLFYAAANTASWALVLLAYVRANQAKQVEPASP